MKKLNKHGIYSETVILPNGLSLKEGEIKFMASGEGIEILSWRFHSNQTWNKYVPLEYPNNEIGKYIALTCLGSNPNHKFIWMPSAIDLCLPGTMHIYVTSLSLSPQVFNEICFKDFLSLIEL